MQPARFSLASPLQAEKQYHDLHENLEMELVFLEGRAEFGYDQMDLLSKARPFAVDASIQSLTRVSFGLEERILKAEQELESLHLKRSEFHQLAEAESPASKMCFGADHRLQQESFAPQRRRPSSASAQVAGRVCRSQQPAVSGAGAARQGHEVKKGPLREGRPPPPTRNVAEHWGKASGRSPVNVQRQQVRKERAAQKREFSSVGTEATRSRSAQCRELLAAQPARQLISVQARRNFTHSTWPRKELMSATVLKTALQPAAVSCNSSETAFESVNAVHDVGSSEPATCIVQ